MNDTQIINLLNRISVQINLILPLILLVAGTFGHACNLFIFSQRSQRTNPISIFFLSSTIANLILLFFGVLLRYLQDANVINFINSNLVVCRIRSFCMYLSLSLSNWYIVLATIDRYLISSDNNLRRRLSTIRNAHRLVGILTIVLILCYSHILILYNIQTSINSSNQLQKYCYPQHGTYRIFSDSQLLVQYSLLPPILMSIFVTLIIRNIRASHKRIADTIVAQQHARLRKRDLQLSKMLILQVSLTIVCSLPFAISQLLTTMTLTWTKTLLRLAIESFFSQLGRNLAYSNCAISFYLYTLAGSQFRREIRLIINRLSMSICRQRILKTRRIDTNINLTPGNVQESVL